MAGRWRDGGSRSRLQLDVYVVVEGSRAAKINTDRLVAGTRGWSPLIRPWWKTRLRLPAGVVVCWVVCSRGCPRGSKYSTRHDSWTSPSAIGIDKKGTSHQEVAWAGRGDAGWQLRLSAAPAFPAGLHGLPTAASLACSMAINKSVLAV